MIKLNLAKPKSLQKSEIFLFLLSYFSSFWTTCIFRGKVSVLQGKVLFLQINYHEDTGWLDIDWVEEFYRICMFIMSTKVLIF